MPPSFVTKDPAAAAEPPKRRRVSNDVDCCTPWVLTSSNNVIYHNHLLTRFDRVALHLKVVFPILFHVASSLRGTWELPLLPYGHKTSTKPQCQTRTEQETSCLKSDDHIWFVILAVGIQDLYLECSDKVLVKVGVGKDGQDIFEEDAWRGKIGILPQCRMQSYLETGEFGGAGGGGGGVSGVRGGVGGGIWLISRGM